MFHSNLNDNPMQVLPVGIFREQFNLNSLNLSGVTINNIDLRHFQANKNLSYM